MAADEDTELRDLVAQTLEANGVLGKIRAQLRSSVFLALEEQDSLQDKPMFVNKQLKNFMNTKDGQLATGVVREFLDHFNMEFTLAVFDPESGCEKATRKSLAKDCGFSDSDKPNKGPLLLSLMKGQHNSVSTKGGDEEDCLKISREISDKDIAKAKAKFQHYDLDHDGFISRDELNKVFNDLLPNFPRSMVDAYVREEFQKSDSDMTGTNEFIKIYKQLVSTCRAVVVNEPVTPPQPTSTFREQSASGDSTLERKNKKNKSETSEKSSKHMNGIEYEDSEPEEDPFFDDPLPKAEKSSSSKPTKNDVAGELDRDIKAIDKKIADIGFDAGDEDYEDDFATNSNLSNKLSARSENKSHSIAEDIDESIEEDLSDEEDKSVDDTTDQTVSINEVSGFDYVEDVSAALP